MDAAPRNSVQLVQLGDEALERISDTLSDLYLNLYGERTVDARASLTGNMLAHVFEGGLGVSDQWLLRSGRGERLREFRQNFFEVVSGEMVGVVGDLTGMPVTYSFSGFDPTTRTTHSIFVLDTTELGGAEQRQAVLNWSEQVRRNARRLREEHRETREVHQALKAQMREKREEVARAEDDDRDAGRSSDDS
ncbi:MAG: DUF2294 family protein [Actinobacteria bacterium]|nr:DUF2294 family protein [Actinomycetota bacterium]